MPTQLPDALFNLSVLTMLTMQPDDDKVAVLSRASRHYKAGQDAVKRLKRWMPGGGYEVSQKLARGLLPKFVKAAKEAEKEAQKQNSNKSKEE